MFSVLDERDLLLHHPYDDFAPVLQLVAQGLPNKGIARRLGISENTAKFHVASLCGKLGASSRTEAVTIAARRGLILL